MIPASATPVKLLLRRITVFCGACIVLFINGCFDPSIPDQDATINIYADKSESNKWIKLEASAVYDTIASTLTCILHFDSSNTIQQDMPVHLYRDGKEISAVKSEKGIAELGWLNAGKYALEIGTPSKYPCFDIHNLYIPSGRKCTLHLYKIPKP